MNVDSIDEFEKAVDEAASLEELDISDLTAKEVRALDWDKLGLFTKIKTLALDDLVLAELPSSLGNLTELKSVTLEKTRKLDWTQAFSVLAQLPNLEQIELKLQSSLESIPDEITKCPALTRLLLFEPKFTELPAAVFSLEKLEALHVVFGSLHSISDDLGRLTRLKSLALENVDLKELTPAIAKLEALERLRLGSNKLKSLPDTIGELPTLTYLDIEGNKIRELPDSFAQLGSLQHLSYNRNGLKEVPPQVCRLRSLTELWLGGNDLQEVPEALCELPLKKLKLFGNPKLDPDSLPSALKGIAQF